MRNFPFARGCLVIALLAIPRASFAQAPELAAIQQQIDQLKQQLQALQDQLARLAAAPPAQTPAPPAAEPQPAVPAAPAEQTATVPPGAEGAGGSSH